MRHTYGTAVTLGLLILAVVAAPLTAVHGSTPPGAGAEGHDPATQRQAERLEFVGQVGGDTKDVVVEGSYAYVAIGPRLVILDVSDPTTPVLASLTDPLPSVVLGLDVSGTTAYLAVGDDGLHTIDVSDPAHPVEAGTYDTGFIRNVTVCLACCAERLRHAG